MQIPSLLAALTCDQIIIDALGGKKTLVGIFDRLFPPSFPWTQRMGFYAKITDGEGTYRLRIRVVHLGQTETVVAGLDGEVHFESPLLPVELALTMPVVFQHEGRYEFQLFVDDVYLGRSTVQAVKLKQEEGQ